LSIITKLSQLPHSERMDTSEAATDCNHSTARFIVLLQVRISSLRLQRFSAVG